MLNKVCFWIGKLSGRIADKPQIKGIVRFVRHHMKTIGAALIALGAALLAFGFQSYFDWKVHAIGTALLVLGVLFVVCGLSLALIGLVTDAKDTRLKVLRPHFEDMRGASPIIPILGERYGQVYSPNSALDRLPNFPPQFRAHFPEQATKWDGYCVDIKAHNEKYAKFKMKIKQSFESQGLEVKDDGGVYQSPYICEAIFHPLFNWWPYRLNPVAFPQVDFTRIDTSIESPSNLYVFGWDGERIAYVGNEAEKRKCKEVITSVAFNIEYEKEAIGLTDSAKGLAKSVSDLDSQLTNIIQNINKNWPITGTNWGTKEYQFRRLTECPVCKLLPK
jgi:hypothetical protein